MRMLLLLLLTAAWIVPVHAQPLTDTTLTWQSYARTGTAAVAVYPTPVDDERYTRVVVLRELAANEGPSILNDASFLAEHVGRTLGFDPVDALWIYHWGSFSFAGAAEARKDVLLRATYRRTSRGALGAPSWRVMTRPEVEEATDRRFP